MTSRFIIYPHAERGIAQAAVSRGWPATFAFHQCDWVGRGRDDDLDDDMQAIIAEHLDYLGAESLDEFLSWMIEDCPSGIIVYRTDPSDGWNFCLEVLITDPDQAFAFRMRWPARLVTA